MVHRLLLDTSSLAYRAFFALPVTITDADDRPVNAVRGYLDMVASLTREHAPDEILHCLDHDWRPAPRVAVYSGYKAERPPDPEALPWQFTLLDEVLEAFGGVRVIAEGWEADDAIGTLCAQAGPGERIDIVTGDRDLLQLVRDGKGPGDAAVRVLFTVKGVRELAAFDQAAVEEKYGIPPRRYVDFAILRGDPSDGLPGVKGVGEKTARDLIREYPSLESLMGAADRLSPKLGQRLVSARDYLAAMRKVVPVRSDAELTMIRGTRDVARLAELAERHALEGPVRRLSEALDA
ncbi:MAG: flap endonuclease [Nitriliruptorales bacterium]|nr:flap endonuclease [Nitriliruptorales bacterium]